LDFFRYDKFVDEDNLSSVSRVASTGISSKRWNIFGGFSQLGGSNQTSEEIEEIPFRR
jgi:hypothetical protein